MQPAKANTPLPSYSHLAPSQGFTDLLRRILLLVDAGAKSDHHLVRLTNEAPTLFSAQLRDVPLEAATAVYLVIESPLLPEQILPAFVQQAKASSRSKLQAIVMSALKGMEVRPMATPPSFLQAKDNATYYRLTNEGPLWSDLLNERVIGINTPAVLQVKSIELVVERS